MLTEFTHFGQMRIAASMRDGPFAVYWRRPAGPGANQARVADSSGFERIQQSAGPSTSKSLAARPDLREYD
jgi:hypothetical protein